MTAPGPPRPQIPRIFLLAFSAVVTRGEFEPCWAAAAPGASKDTGAAGVCLFLSREPCQIWLWRHHVIGNGSIRLACRGAFVGWKALT